VATNIAMEMISKHQLTLQAAHRCMRSINYVQNTHN